MHLSWKRILAHTKYPFHIARPGSSVQGDGTEVHRVIVSIEHDGIVGLGEAAPAPYYNQDLDTVEHMLQSCQPLLGDDPEEIDTIVDRLLDAFDDQRAAVAAVDAALHDLLGKRCEQPVWRLLGLDPSETPPTSFTVGIDRLELLPEKIAQTEPFSVLKVKVGTEAEIETLEALRKLVPTKRIRVDANCGWPPDQLVPRIAALKRFDIELIEQPTEAGRLDDVRQAKPSSFAPLIADEDSIVPADVDRLAGVYDGINIKLSKCGGIREAVRMARAAHDRGLSVMFGCMIETSLGVSAAVHISSLADYVDLDAHMLLADDPYQGLMLSDGVVLPGKGSGLGVVPRR